MNYDAEAVERARQMAIEAHKGQTRRDGSPYYHHPLNVCEKVLEWSDFQNLTAPQITRMAIAALAHDILEDVPTFNPLSLAHAFPRYNVLSLVYELTKAKMFVVAAGNGKRLTLSHEKGLRYDLAHWLATSWEARVIKLCDVLDNLEDLDIRDTKFAKRFVSDKEKLLSIIGSADAGLRQDCFSLILKAKKQLYEVP